MSSVGSPKKPMSNLGRDIPRRMRLNSASQLPFDYCTTPGGTLFSTTPGGTRIIYDRSFLINLRNSPMARSPPCGMPNIAGVTSPSTNGKENKLNMRGKARSSSLSVNAPVFSPSSRASPTNNITGSSSAEALMTQVNTATTTPIIANAITKNETKNENTGDMPVDEPQFQFDM